VEITPSGRFPFTVNTGSGTIPATRSPPAARWRCWAAPRSVPPAASARSTPASAPTAATCTSMRAGSAPSARGLSTAATWPNCPAPRPRCPLGPHPPASWPP